MIIVFALLGAIIYRWRGYGGKYKKYFPRPLPQMLFALPYGYLAWNVHWVAGIAVYALTVLALVTGHGGWHDLGDVIKKRARETMEFIIRPLRNNLRRYWYDALGLALSGLLITFPCGIATLNPVIALSGVLKAPAYMIGQVLTKDQNRQTEIGEVLTGLFLWFLLGLFIW